MYAIYLRKSRKDMELEAIGEGETLARHREALLELARKKELVISKIYEEVVSGESIADRPQMQQLLYDVMMGKYKGVLVMEIERLARGNTKDQGEVAEAFAMSETLIITPIKIYDPTNEFDEEYFEFGLFMSRREYKTINRRMQRGRIASVREGNYIASKRPYGYDIIKMNKKDITLKLNEEEAPYVKLMYDWYVNDRLTTGVIAKRLTEMGVPTINKKSEWSKATIKGILQNDVYRGKIKWNSKPVTKELIEGKVVKKRRTLSKDDERYILVDGKHPPIIDDELFFKAQDMMKNSIPVKYNFELVNPLANLMFCANCGKGISLQRNLSRDTTKPRYIHGQSYKCKMKSMPYQDVMDALIHSLKLIADDFEVKITNEHKLQTIEKNQIIIETMNKELKTLEEQRTQLFGYLERNIYTEEEFLERKNIINKKIKTIKNTILEKQKSNETKIDYEEKIIKFNELIETLSDDSISAKDKNTLLKTLVERIDYDCEDFGFNKGGRVILDIYLRS